MNDDRDAIERQIHAACEAHDYERAATLAIEHYGPELLGFLVRQLRDADGASEVFGRFSELFWQTLPRFEWRCTVRTWAYKLARRAAAQHRSQERKHGANTPLTQLSQLSVAVERVRTATEAYKRTDVKDRFQELREHLSEEDQSLLILRIDRGLSWLELAEIMLGEDQPASDEQLKTESARLRKRYQVAKEQLRKLAQAEGLLES